MKDRPTFWERIEEYPLWRLMAYVFLVAISERLIVTLIFFARWGWHTVSGIELWFYYGVAKGTFDLYSVWDPSWWILSALGALVSGPALLYGTYLVSSLSSSLNAALFCLFVSELHSKKTGFLAGILYGSMVLPMFNSAGTVTHDIFAYPYLILSVYGAVAAGQRKGWRKLPFAGLCILALFLGRHVGPTIFVGAGTIGLFLLWQAVLAFLGDNRLTRILALILTPLLICTFVYFGGTFIFGAVTIVTLLIALVAVAVFFGAWEVVRLGLIRKLPSLLLGLFAVSIFIFGWLLLYYRVLGERLTVESVWSWLIIVSAGTLISYLLLRFTRSTDDLGHFTVALFLVILFILVVLLQFEIIPRMMEKTYELALKERGIDVRAQIKAGSGDLLASSLGDYWLRFNFLLYFLPVGLWVAFRKKDMLGWALILSGFIMSLAADRGTRPLTFGFALMGALAFVNWKPIYGWLLALWMCFIIGEFGGKYSTEYAVFFPSAALFIFYSIQWPRHSRHSLLSSIVLFLSLFGILAGFVILSVPGLRDSMGIFALPSLPGGLLRTASGFSFLFIAFSLATIAILIYLVKLWIADNRAPKWIWAIFSLTALWMMAGSFLGGVMFQAKELGNPEILKKLDGINGIAGESQVAAINAIMRQLQITVDAVRRYWTVQICLIVPGLLLLLGAAVSRCRIPDNKKDQKKSPVYLWFRNSAVRQSLFISIGLLVFMGVIVVIQYIGFLRGAPLFAPDEFLNQAVIFFWDNLKYFFAGAIGVIIFILSWPGRAERDAKQYLTGVAVVCWLFATVIPSMNQTAKSTEGEYLIYKWLSDHANGKGRIFVPWSDGYMAEAISGLPSELSPENIDFNLPRLYWMPEEPAARLLASRGLDYIVISSKYFKLIRYNQKTGEFQYSFSPDIIYQPQQLGINNVNQLKPATLYRLLYSPRDLTNFQLLHYEKDPAVNEAYLLYRVIPPVPNKISD